MLDPVSRRHGGPIRTYESLVAEVRLIDPVTGAQKGSKLARYDLIPADALEALAEVYGAGAQKYSNRNWEAGYSWGWSFAACMRHLWAFWRGHDRDAESGMYHLAHAAWHCLAMLTFVIRNIGTDDRSYKEEEARVEG